MGSGHDERERPSWRDIDRRRDRSRHVSGNDREERSSFKSEAEKQRYLKEAEKLFGGRGPSEAELKGLKEIEKHHGTPRFNPAVRKHLKEFGLPGEWRILTFLLDYEDTQLVSDEVLTALAGQWKERSTAEKNGLRYRLESLAMTTTDPLVEAAVNDFLDRVLD